MILASGKTVPCRRSAIAAQSPIPSRPSIGPGRKDLLPTLRGHGLRGRGLRRHGSIFALVADCLSACAGPPLQTVMDQHDIFVGEQQGFPAHL